MTIPSGFLGAIIQSQYGDLIKQGSALIQKAIAGLADVQEAEAQSGVTRDNETARRVTSGEGKTTTEATSRTVTTVDHIKQAEYLRNVVNPGINQLAEGLLKGEIRIGKQTIELGKILALVQQLSKSSAGSSAAATPGGKEATVTIDIEELINAAKKTNKETPAPETNPEAPPSEESKYAELKAIAGTASKGEKSFDDVVDAISLYCKNNNTDIGTLCKKHDCGDDMLLFIRKVKNAVQCPLGHNCG